jgi:hypothetical protein
MVATQELTLVVCTGEVMGSHLGQDIDSPKAFLISYFRLDNFRDRITN